VHWSTERRWSCAFGQRHGIVPRVAHAVQQLGTTVTPFA
jgi:hypothetical protein